MSLSDPNSPPASDDAANLTTRQQLLWIEHRLNPGLPLHNMVATFEIAGAIEPGLLERAFQTVVQHSDALRTVIEEKGGVPRCRVLPPGSCPMDFLDLSAEADPASACEAWLEQRCARPFRLEERLVDSALLRLGEDRFLWYLCQHHVIADAWSFSLAYRRTAELYSRLREGAGVDRLAEPLAWPRFETYIEHETSQRGSAVHRAAESYWRQKLSRAVGPLELYGRRSGSSPWIRRLTRELGAERSARLGALASEQGVKAVPPSLTLPAIFATTLLAHLHRVSQDSVLSIGLPVTNRQTKDFKETIGLFIEVCPLVVEILPDETFSSLLQKVKRDAYECLQHARYSQSNPLRRKAYQAMLNFHGEPYPPFAGMAVKATLGTALQLARPPETCQATYNGELLSLHVRPLEDGGGFALDFDFDRAAFDEAQCQRAAQHFIHLLDGFLANREQPLRQVEILSAEERGILLGEFQRTDEDYPRDRTVVDLFEEQAGRLPDKAAVTCGSETLTYRDLSARVDRLAQRLQGLGVQAGVLVGICVRRSIDMLVAMLATLRAGGAYVPIDPTHPQRRNALILEDARPRLLVTGGGLQEMPPAGPGTAILCLDDRDAVPAADARPAPASDPSSLAYVIFTSGSTGRPKGVEICHRALTNLLCSMRQRPGMAETDRLLAVTPVSFDIAGLELFLPLIAGASLEIADEVTCADAERLRRKLEGSGTTILQATPATWRMMVESGWQGDGSLKILCGGEALSQDLAGALVRRGASVWNLYGPTETTIWSTVHRVESGETQPPIGKPIANTRAYVLDAELRPVPIGVSGELFLAGDGLSRGYHGRPDLTGERFVRGSTVGEDRLYRTGDLARFLPGGELECLGRLDHQVKVRGFRIELGEIEAALRHYPGIQEAVATAHDHGAGDRRLVAHAVCSAPADLDEEAVLSFLRQRLPGYMVPSRVIPLTALPLTPNGKVDRKALPPPPAAGAEAAAAAHPLRDDIEKALATLWSEILGRGVNSSQADFFEVGGHSLLAVRLLAGIRSRFGVELPLSVLFDEPTIEGSARVIRDALADPARGAGGRGIQAPSYRYLVPLHRGLPGERPLFIAAGAMGTVLNLRHLAALVGAERPVHGLQAHGVASDELPRETFEAMAADYLADVREAQPAGPYLLAGFCSGGVAAYELAQQLRAAGEETMLLILIDSFVCRHTYLSRPSDVLQFHWQRLRRDGLAYVVEWTRGRLERGLSRLRGSPDGAGSEDPAQRRSRVVFRRTFEAMDRYAPERYPGRAILLRPPLDGECLVGGREVNRRREIVRADNGWGAFIDDLSIHEIAAKPGDHDGILEPPAVGALAAELRRAIQEAERRVLTGHEPSGAGAAAGRRSVIS